MYMGLTRLILDEREFNGGDNGSEWGGALRGKGEEVRKGSLGKGYEWLGRGRGGKGGRGKYKEGKEREIRDGGGTTRESQGGERRQEVGRRWGMEEKERRLKRGKEKSKGREGKI